MHSRVGAFPLESLFSFLIQKLFAHQDTRKELNLIICITWQERIWLIFIYILLLKPITICLVCLTKLAIRDNLPKWCTWLASRMNWFEWWTLDWISKTLSRSTLFEDRRTAQICAWLALGSRISFNSWFMRSCWNWCDTIQHFWIWEFKIVSNLIFHGFKTDRGWIEGVSKG